MYIISRIYNKMIFFMIKLFISMIWDYTGSNKNIIDYLYRDLNYPRDILARIPKGD